MEDCAAAVQRPSQQPRRPGAYRARYRHPSSPGRRTRRGRRAGIALAVLAALAAGTGCGGAAPAAPHHGRTGAGSAAGGPGSGSLGGLGHGDNAGGPGAPETTGAGQRSGVSGGALFGADAPLASAQQQLGRRLAIFRVYYRFGMSFPVARDRALMAAGSTLLVSYDTLPGGATYASIAAGHEDRTIMIFLDSVERAAIQYHLGAIYFCFEHEANDPATHAGLGTPAQFVLAWDHVHQLAESAHLAWNSGGRIHFVFILTHLAYTPVSSRPPWALAAGTARSYWPGASQVDVVAADGYNSQGCRHAIRGEPFSATRLPTSPSNLFGSLLSFAQAQGGLPVFIAEWGSTSRAPPADQPGFIQQMQAYVSGNPEIAAALYWGGRPPHGPCDYSITGNPRSVAAFAAMGHAPALQGQVRAAG